MKVQIPLTLLSNGRGNELVYMSVVPAWEHAYKALLLKFKLRNNIRTCQEGLF